jgi:hypothetical protein
MVQAVQLDSRKDPLRPYVQEMKRVRRRRRRRMMSMMLFCDQARLC